MWHWITLRLTLYPLPPTLRLWSALLLLASIGLVAWRVASASKMRLRNKATNSTALLEKSDTFNNNAPTGLVSNPASPHSMSIGTDKGKSSPARVAALALCMALAAVGMFSIPVEHASVVNQEKETGWLYLPHVSEEMDQYHFWAVDERGERKFLTFCADKGFVPQWNEGQTVKFSYRAWPTCIEILSLAGLRDEHGKLIGR